MRCVASGRLLTVGFTCWLLADPTLNANRQQVFRAATNAVPLWVAVTTRDGDHIPHLVQDDFEVLDNGRRAEIVAFEHQVAPLALRILTSHTPRLHKDAARVRSMAYSLIDQALATEPLGMNPADSDLPAFGDPREYGLFSTDKDRLRRYFERIFAPAPTEGLVWWNALHGASNVLLSAPTTTAMMDDRQTSRPLIWSTTERPGIRAVVVLTPGMDEGDKVPGAAGGPERYARQALYAGTVVYGVLFGGRSRDKRLVKLAPDTSGWWIEPTDKTNLTAEVSRILADLRNRYLVGFIPVVFDGREHRVTVRVRRPDLVVRARTAYMAPKPQ